MEAINDIVDALLASQGELNSMLAGGADAGDMRKFWLNVRAFVPRKVRDGRDGDGLRASRTVGLQASRLSSCWTPSCRPNPQRRAHGLTN